MTRPDLPKAYDPGGIEERLYTSWEADGLFRAEAADPRKPFCIVIPPPNVTGALHMGHALDNTLQDILIRYKRMDGFAALWLPGTDHAGIATQNVVERALEKEGTNRHDLGREAFLQKVWDWKALYGGRIVKQLRRLGASCDWTRERFTMDAGLSRAVRAVFVALYNEGLIYRSKYLISRCPRCRTALSDLEVAHEEQDGELTYFAYETTQGERLTVATTRPETMLGDTAVAVHPDDARYRRLVGSSLRHPFLDRTFPVVADSAVDPAFGTGAVKVTPAHDPADYEIASRHGLEFISVLDDEARMTAEAGPFAGLDRYEARRKVVDELKARGLLEKVESYRHAVGRCQRCRTAVEPSLSEQWFVKVAPLAAEAIAAVRDGRTVFIPEHWTKTYLDWMENIRDWCISRQLWWGHRIPVWYCSDCGGRTVSEQDPSACSKCRSPRIEQDSDVLDTWFSSSLWPFSTLGWPEQTADLSKFYPTSVLVTGFDIIFFWVARMMMMGLKFMKDVPFRKVHIHAIVRDEHGKKMSKSRGNVVDPLAVMDAHGTDAFRFTLAASAAQGRDLLLSDKRIEGHRYFINKLWNSARFALQKVGDGPFELGSIEPKTLPDRWIVDRLRGVTSEVRQALDEMRFNHAAEALYRFTWHEFCDWYLESIKPHFEQPTADAERLCSERTLLYVLDSLLRLLHPFVPFVTEEIWRTLPIVRETRSIMTAPFPSGGGEQDDEAAAAFSVLEGVVTAIRNIRSENEIPPGRKIRASVRTAPGRDDSTLQTLRRYERYVVHLARLDTLDCAGGERAGNCALALSGNLEIYVPLEGLAGTDAERERLTRQLEKAVADREFLDRRLLDPDYRSRAPAGIIARDEKKLADARERVSKIERSLSELPG